MALRITSIHLWGGTRKDTNERKVISQGRISWQIRSVLLVVQFDFQCLQKHLPTSPLNLSASKRIHTTATTIRGFRVNRQQVWDPKLMKLVVVLFALQTPNIFFWVVQAMSRWDQPFLIWEKKMYFNCNFCFFFLELLKAFCVFILSPLSHNLLVYSVGLTWLKVKNSFLWWRHHDFWHVHASYKRGKLVPCMNNHKPQIRSSAFSLALDISEVQWEV